MRSPCSIPNYEQKKMSIEKNSASAAPHFPKQEPYSNLTGKQHLTGPHFCLRKWPARVPSIPHTEHPSSFATPWTVSSSQSTTKTAKVPEQQLQSLPPSKIHTWIEYLPTTDHTSQPSLFLFYKMIHLYNTFKPPELKVMADGFPCHRLMNKHCVNFFLGLCFISDTIYIVSHVHMHL